MTHTIPSKSPVRERAFLSPRLQEISRRVRVLRFGMVRKRPASPWTELAGMFRFGHKVNVEEMLDARGFDESATRL
ncbi:MAG: hypothetical protein H5T61_14015 [Thermoflexales bacterium]|nr:hypothetical protein [Thermoflexales bacterium]